MSILDENDRHRPSYRALVDALADEFTTKELTEIADMMHDYEGDVGGTPATDTLLKSVQEVIGRP